MLSLALLLGAKEEKTFSPRGRAQIPKHRGKPPVALLLRRVKLADTTAGNHQKMMDVVDPEEARM